MLKFVKEHLQSIEGVAIFPIISLLIFACFFVVLFIWVFLMKREHISRLKNIPFLSNESLPKL